MGCVMDQYVSGSLPPSGYNSIPAIVSHSPWNCDNTVSPSLSVRWKHVRSRDLLARLRPWEVSSYYFNITEDWRVDDHDCEAPKPPDDDFHYFVALCLRISRSSTKTVLRCCLHGRRSPLRMPSKTGLATGGNSSCPYVVHTTAHSSGNSPLIASLRKLFWERRCWERRWEEAKKYDSSMSGRQDIDKVPNANETQK